VTCSCESWRTLQQLECHRAAFPNAADLRAEAGRPRHPGNQPGPRHDIEACTADVGRHPITGP